MAAHKKSVKLMTRGERVCEFIERYCRVPEGALVGQPLRLAPFQRKFIIEVYDNPHGTRRAILSKARKNAKTATIAAIVLAHTIGPERVQNSQIVSGALSRDQAGLVFNLASKMLRLNPVLEGLYRIVPSSKTIHGLRSNVEYRALSAEASTAHGLSPVVAVLDEVGQVRGPTHHFVDAITTSQGAHANPLLFVISTQAATDADMLSLWIDDAQRSADPHTVCHLYAADKDCDLLDKEQWRKANPALGLFRDEKDLEEQLKRASRIPALEASARNLLLNQRVAQESLWLAPAIWRENNHEPDLAVFQRNGAHVGLDLSQRQDLTAAVLSAADDIRRIHLLPFVFTPATGLAERAARDRAPYELWVKQGLLIAVPGKSISYEWVAEWMARKLAELKIEPLSVQFDRWRINEFKLAASRHNFASTAEWFEVGQGFKDMSPRVEAFENALLEARIRHGGHPLLNLGASGAVVIKDPAGNRKLTKAEGKSTTRIDALQAAVMSAYPLEAAERFDIAALIA